MLKKLKSGVPFTIGVIGGSGEYLLADAVTPSHFYDDFELLPFFTRDLPRN